MSRYIIKGESLSALADEIRVLSNTEDEMGIDTMKSSLSLANSKVATQADIIEQISDTLKTKASAPDYPDVEKETF